MDEWVLINLLYKFKEVPIKIPSDFKNLDQMIKNSYILKFRISILFEIEILLASNYSKK